MMPDSVVTAEPPLATSGPHAIISDGLKRASSTSVNAVLSDRNDAVDRRPPGKKLHKEATEAVQVPRNYQQELFDLAKSHNIIAVMDTGTGKTFIAVLLIQHVMGMEYESARSSNKAGFGKCVFFVVPTVPLVDQQRTYLAAQFGQAAVKVAPAYGQVMSNQKQEDWKRLRSSQVIVSTPQVLVDALNRAYIKMKDIALIVLDEAHHATKDSPYAILMREHYHQVPVADRPRILGLTASPVNANNSGQISVSLLERTLDAKAVTILMDDTAVAYSSRAKPEVCRYRPTDLGKLPALYRRMKYWVEAAPQFKGVAESATEMMKELGPWACATNLWSSVNTVLRLQDKRVINRTSKGEDVLISEATQKALLDDISPLVPSETPRLEDLSPKVHRLINILRGYRHDDRFAGIVFVERRDTATMLKTILASSKELEGFIRVGVLLGHNSRSTEGIDSSMHVQEQAKTVIHFKKGVTNLLIATSIGEEGLDIQSCKLVVRFTLNMNLLNFIQSRGRARARNSRFILMLQDGDDWAWMQIHKLINSEEQLRKDLASRYNAIRTVDVFDARLPPNIVVPYEYRTDRGATVTLTSALEVLNRFCDALEGDAFTACKPHYSITPLPSSEHERFQATVMLPNFLPPNIRFVCGLPMRTKALAYRHAAFETVKLLHQEAYLDDHLRPVGDDTVVKTKKGILSEADVQELHLALTRLKTKKAKRWHEIAVPRMFQLPWIAKSGLDEEFIECHLNVLDTQYVHQTEPEASMLGFLTVESMPTPSLTFPLWPNLVEMKVRIQTSPQSIKISKRQFELAKKYNFLVLSTMLKHTLFEADKDYAFIVIPLKIAKASPPVDYTATPADVLIDWEAVDAAVNFEPTRHRGDLYKPSLVPNMVLVDKRHWSRKYVALELLQDKTPFDKVPFGDEKYTCAADYYTTLKDKTKIRRDQPVIRARMVMRKFNMLAYHNIAENENVEAKRDAEVFLVPQFCEPYSITQDVILAAGIFPSVLYYVELACRTSELKKDLNIPASLPALITALSAPSATLQTNYERYETLGDSFLKLAITLHLFALHPHRHEGVMTMMCHKLVSNYELFLRACMKRVPGYMIAQKLSRTEWRPIVIPDHKAWEEGQDSSVPEEKSLQDMEPTQKKKSLPPVTMSKQILSNKQVADAMEAILGASIDSHGLKGGAQALHSIFSDAVCIDFSEYMNRIPLQSTGTMRPAKAAAVAQTQEILQYQFKNPLLLSQALTHPSSTDPLVPNYQRLEFLGDAVLGFLAVRHFFNKYPDLPPGRLVDLKDAAVNNAFLANISANLGLHVHIDRFSAPLNDAIAEYVEKLRAATEKFEQNAESRRKKLDAINHFPESRLDTKKLQRQIEQEIQYWMDIDTPKAVSDVFEAICGAIYLDNNLDHEAVWAMLQRCWLPWVDEYIQPHIVGRHPFRELAGYFRSVVRCDAWRVPTKHDTEEYQFVANLIVHAEVVDLEYGTSRKAARRALAEKVLDMVEVDPDFIRRRCTCGDKGKGSKASVDVGSDVMLEKDEDNMHARDDKHLRDLKSV
ncbi:Dicer-like protein 1 [Gaertneriomyces sp. JEL0708]|nr:Dicer-like protein 1 [Gaertneriomyces sp. JEL0708]